MRDKTIASQLLVLLQLVLYVMWPVTAVAAQLSFSRSLTTPDMMLDLVLTFGLSVLVGLTALLVQMKREYEASGKIDRLWLFISSKMSCSIVAGVAMYFGAAWMGLSRDATVASIILASFSGTVALERAAQTMLDKCFPHKAA